MQLRDAIAGLYDAWWDKRAPARTRLERAAATAARKRAIAGNWCAAAALDDDQLDTPGYRPRYGWKPATGTGTAPDIHPAARPEEEGRMTERERMNPDLIRDVLDVLERHGYARADERAYPPGRPAHRRPGPHLRRRPGRSRSARTTRSRCPGPNPVPEPAAQDTVTVPAGEVTTLLTALDDATEY